MGGGVFGYTFVLGVDDGVATAVAITSHGVGADDSTAQDNPDDPALHSHLLTAQLGSSNCPNSAGAGPDGNEVLTASLNEVGKVSVDGHILKITGVHPSLNIDETAAVIGFTIYFGPGSGVFHLNSFFFFC